jgi:hypothetical protein
VFQQSLVSRVLSTDYAAIYSAYDLGFYGHIRDSYGLLGPIWLLLCLVGLLLAVLRRNRMVIFYALLAVVSYLFFQSTQKLGPHHFLPMMFWLIPAASWPIWLAITLRSSYARVFVGISTPLVLLLTWLTHFSAGLHSSFVPVFPRAMLSWLLPARPFPPLKLRAYPDLVRFSAQIRRQLPPGSRIAVAASSNEFNSEILDALLQSTGRSSGASGFAVRTLGDIDLRDGFDLQVFQHSDYLIVSSRPFLHRPAQFQRVVAVPVDLFSQEPSPMRPYWRLLFSCHPAGLPRIDVYQRVQSLRPVDQVSEAALLVDAFAKAGSRVHRNGDRILFR